MMRCTSTTRCMAASCHGSPGTCPVTAANLCGGPRRCPFQVPHHHRHLRCTSKVTCRPLLLIFCCASSPSASQAPSHLEAESLLRILPNPKTQLLVDSRRPGGPPGRRAGTQVPVTVTATMLCRRLARLHTIVSPSSCQLEPRACHGTWTEGPRVAVCSSLSCQARERRPALSSPR